MVHGSNTEKIINLRRDGKSYRFIKKELGCSRSLISYVCERAGLTDIGLTKKKITDDNIELLKEFYKSHTIEETMEKFGVSRSTVIRYKESKRIIHTDETRREANYQHVATFRRRTKEKAVAYKGGKCVVCSYDRCISAMDFHHLDPKEKDFGLSQNMSKAWNKIEEELDKCVLLCANCHREVHEGIITL